MCYHEPATNKQKNFIDHLLGWKAIPADFIEYNAATASRMEASKVIDTLLKMPNKSQAEVAPPEAPVTIVIPNGRYAITGEDGTTDFYKVSNGKPNSKWEGVIFLDLLTGAPGGFAETPIISRVCKKVILGKIAQDVEGACRRFGIEVGVCGICGSPLTNPESIAYGIGAKCREKVGF
jgi:hypothetical protein